MQAAPRTPITPSRAENAAAATFASGTRTRTLHFMPGKPRAPFSGAKPAHCSTFEIGSVLAVRKPDSPLIAFSADSRPASARFSFMMTLLSRENVVPVPAEAPAAAVDGSRSMTTVPFSSIRVS